MEFKELTKKDAQISLALELDKLVRTCSEGERQVLYQWPWYRIKEGCTDLPGSGAGQAGQNLLRGRETGTVSMAMV
jgi:hypothetical protein